MHTHKQQTLLQTNNPKADHLAYVDPAVDQQQSQADHLADVEPAADQPQSQTDQLAGVDLLQTNHNLRQTIWLM